MIGVKTVGRSICKNGFVISTIHIGLPSTPFHSVIDFFETAIWNKYSDPEVVERYEAKVDALTGHANYIKINGGTSLLDWLLP